jgi:hypothetical protein
MATLIMKGVAMSILLSEEQQAYLEFFSGKLTRRQKRIFKHKICGDDTAKTAYIEGISRRTVQRELRIIENILSFRPPNTHSYIGE